MAYTFATEEWVKALQTELNGSEAYGKAAAKWEGDFYFVLEKGPGIDEDVYLYLDLWHGEARDAYVVDDPAMKKTEFELRAPLSVWKGVLEQEIDPIRGIMSGQLKLKGPKIKIIRSPKAATALVETAARLDTSWPA